MRNATINHVNRIVGKLGAHSRVEAVLIWQAAAAPACGELPAPRVDHGRVAL